MRCFIVSFQQNLCIKILSGYSKFFYILRFFFISILQRNNYPKNCKKNGWRINRFQQKLYTKTHLCLVRFFVHKPFNLYCNSIHADKNLGTLQWLYFICCTWNNVRGRIHSTNYFESKI